MLYVNEVTHERLREYAKANGLLMRSVCDAAVTEYLDRIAKADKKSGGKIDVDSLKK